MSQILLYLLVLLALVRPLGAFMARVYTGEHTWLSRAIAPLERLVYRVADTRGLRSYARMLREKIEPDPAQPRFLVTEPGVGYRLIVER